MSQGNRTDGSVHFGVFDLDVQSEELRKQGVKIRLPHQSFQILARLLESPGEVVTREELRQLLWPGDTFVDFDVGLNSAVKRLRDALGDAAENARFVETLSRRGYRFIGPITGPRQPAVAETPLPADVVVLETPRASIDTTILSTEPEVGGFPLSRRATTAALVLLMVSAGLAILGVATRNRAVAAKPPSIRSVAVLPLANLTGDPAQEYFADGMTDALITELAQVSDVRVIARTSVTPYKRSQKSASVVGGELNVDAIVEGTVVRSGTRVRIDAQLIDTRNELHIWAKGYEREGNDIVALQGDVAKAIAEAIAGKLTPQQRSRTAARRINPEASDLYFKAMYAAGREGYEGFTHAIDYAGTAIAKQPDFAEAYAAMALWYTQFSFVGPLRPLEFMPKAEVAARKALELDETTSGAHVALGLVLYRYYWDWPAAESHFRRALELNPSDADGHRVFGVFLLDRGRTSEAQAEAQHARELDPLSAQALLNLANAHGEAGQNEQAITEYRKLLETNPDLGRAHTQLGLTYIAKRDFDAGIRELRAGVTLSHRNPPNLTNLGYALAVVGNKAEAQSILSELNALSRRRFVSPLGIAGIQSGLGQRDAAFASLEKACEVRDPLLSRLIIDSRLEPLRSDPRFQALARRVGLAPQDPRSNERFSTAEPPVTLR